MNHIWNSERQLWQNSIREVQQDTISSETLKVDKNYDIVERDKVFIIVNIIISYFVCWVVKHRFCLRCLSPGVWQHIINLYGFITVPFGFSLDANNVASPPSFSVMHTGPDSHVHPIQRVDGNQRRWSWQKMAYKRLSSYSIRYPTAYMADTEQPWPMGFQLGDYTRTQAEPPDAAMSSLP